MAEDAERVRPLPPPAICSERVFHYAILDESVGNTSGHRLKTFDGEEFEGIPRLAICRREDTAAFTIYCCTADWEALAVLTASDTVEAAKRQAEHRYPGSSVKWVEVHFTEEDVSRYLDEIWGDLRCSFCGKRPDQDIESIVEAKDGSARICDKCIAEFSRK